MFFGIPYSSDESICQNDIFTCLHQHIVGDFGSKQNGFVTLVDGVRGQLPGLRLVALAAQRLACAYQRRLRNGDHMVDMYMRMDQVSTSMIFTCEYIGRWLKAAMSLFGLYVMQSISPAFQHWSVYVNLSFHQSGKVNTCRNNVRALE